MSTNPNIAALILRLSLGTIFLAHGAYLKLVIFGLAGTVGFFASLGLPGWFAYVVIAAEIAAGLGMIFGVLTRWAALGMVPISLGAAWAHWGNGWTFSAPGGGWEFPVFLALASLALAFLGNGAFALGKR